MVGHYDGETAPELNDVRVLNTGIPLAKASVVCEDGDIVVKVAMSGYSIMIR